ncbi:MAG: hypothetical protein RMJ14_04140 [Nitrososphaerota archaeon]|nr:hypothetical protein [Aigarchaeota archaeon]MDW8076809.1 hypothetical protein [Nitrososphaerota archaeon]
MDRKKMLIVLLSTVAVAVMVAVTATYPVVSATAPLTNVKQTGLPVLDNGNPETVPNVWPYKMMRLQGCFGFVEVSEGFKERVLSIAKSDEDVQNLINDGYNIVGVRPIVKTIVEEDGSITKKATGAIVTLNKDSARAIVKVDVENAKVTEIVILTETTITKP